MWAPPQQKNRTGPQEGRRPKLPLLLLLKNKAEGFGVVRAMAAGRRARPSALPAGGQVEAAPRGRHWAAGHAARCNYPLHCRLLSEMATFFPGHGTHVWKTKVNFNCELKDIPINVFLFLCRQTSILLQDDYWRKEKQKKGKKTPEDEKRQSSHRQNFCCSACHIWSTTWAAYWGSK